MRTTVITMAACGVGLLLGCATAPAVEPSPRVTPTSSTAQGAETTLAEPAPAAEPKAPPPLQPSAPVAAPEGTADCVQNIDPSASPESQLECLLVTERWKALLDTVSTAVRTQLMAQFAMLPPEKVAPLTAALDQYAAGPRLYSEFKAQLTKVVASLGVAEQLAFYRTPLGAKYLSVASAQADPEVVSGWLAKNKPAAKRKQWIAAYEKSAHSVDILRTLFVRPTFTMMKTALSAEEQKDAPDESPKELLEALTKRSREMTTYALRDFTDSEIRELSTHLASAARQQSIEAILAGLSATVDSAYAPLGPSVRAALQEQVALLRSLGNEDEGAQ